MVAGDRTSAYDLGANQFGVFFFGLVLVLLCVFTRLGPEAAKLVHARGTFIHLNLLQTSAITVRNARPIHFLLITACPLQYLYVQVASRPN